MTMPSRMPEPYGQGGGANLADILERVLDKGIVIAGDIRINLLDIELLTIKLRLIVCSVDKAKEMGIDWWEDDPELSSRARSKELTRENTELRAHVAELEELEQGRAERRKPARRKVEQGKTEQGKTEQGKTERSKAEESA
ncbi:gas vesicle protein GvpJ [Streptomyces sp. NPDC057302]|uniref:gas vesicle protein n=1 Tax=Streptomyces sp. NPDC057302 TaxID=3346094 RepID=UPI00363223C1